MIRARWSQGRIKPWWKHEHTQLDYINEPFNAPQDQARWQQLGYTQTRFTGDMYDMRFTEPAWIDHFRLIWPLRHFSWSVYRMRPGDVLPEHADTYHRFCKIHHIADIQHIYRCVVFLEDWQSGHYLEIDQQPVVNWQAGDWVCWQGDTPHLAANVGETYRYTLQLTGVT